MKTINTWNNEHLQISKKWYPEWLTNDLVDKFNAF